MKLLFDNNLSLRLLARLQDVFTDSQHVAYLGGFVAAVEVDGEWI